MKIGFILKDFSLKGVDGNTYTLESFSKARILVVVFISNDSKYSRAYISRLKKIQNEFLEKNI